MEENREAIEDLARRYGFDAKEARASYHLREAGKLFEELHAEYVEELHAEYDSPWVAATLGFRVHFAALSQELGMRVLRRNYPDGWGRPQSQER
jgi:hypothetical protein